MSKMMPPGHPELQEKMRLIFSRLNLDDAAGTATPPPPPPPRDLPPMAYDLPDPRDFADVMKKIAKPLETACRLEGRCASLGLGVPGRDRLIVSL
jgi:hypothetical protein